MDILQGKRILAFVGDIYEDLELLYPRLRLIEAGAEVVTAGEEKGRTYHGKHGYPFTADADLADMRPEDFDGLLVPGGFMPDRLRRLDVVKTLTREIFEAGKPLAHICHGGWIPISAGIVKGYTCTSTPGIKDDLVNAGATWVDQEVVVDRTMVSSRKPDDLPAFCREFIKMLVAK